MEMDEKVLARKMKARLARERERQRRWREKQHQDGRKSLTCMISSEAYDALQQERERSGERVADILERAILGMVASGVTSDVMTTESGVTEPAAPVVLDEEYVLAEIRKMRSDEGLPFNEIAHRLNLAGISAPDGFAPWQGRQVYELYKTLPEGEPAAPKTTE